MITSIFRNNLSVPIVRLFDRSDLKVEIIINSFRDGVSLVRDSAKMELKEEQGQKYMYFFDFQNIPSAGTYYLDIQAKAPNNEVIYKESLDVSIIEDSLGKTSNVFFDGKYLSNQELLEMATGVFKVPFPTKIDANGNVTYTLIEGKYKPIVFDKVLPLGSYVTIYKNDLSLQQVSINGVCNIPVMTTSMEGRPRGFNYDPGLIADKETSYVLIVGVEVGNYVLKTWYNQKEISKTIKFSISS
jgi:hypothetical protein